MPNKATYQPQRSNNGGPAFLLVVTLIALLFPSLGNAAHISSGYQHLVVLRPDGSVWQNGAGQNGIVRLPSYQGPLRQVISVSAGGDHTLALRSDGTVWAWGRSYGLAVEHLGWLINITAIDASDFYNVALQSDGTVWEWHYTSSPYLMEDTNGIPLKGAIALAVASTHRVVLKSDGTVWTWGTNELGQLGNGTYVNSYVPVQVKLNGMPFNEVVAIEAGQFFTVALKSNGTVWTWGRNNEGQLGNNTYTNSPVPVRTPLSAVVAISAGIFHTLALKSNGTVWTWGRNNEGQLGRAVEGLSSAQPGPIILSPNTVAISAGSLHSAIVMANGRVWAWGSNSGGFLGTGSTANYIYVPEQIPNLITKTSASIAAGSYHTTVPMTNGSLWQWGENSYGQLGNGQTNAGDFIPAPVTGFMGMRAVAARGQNTVALKADGTVWTWGRNLEGELGTGTPDTLSNVPVQVTTLSSVNTVACGDLQTMALRSDGTVVACGLNNFGQLGIGTTQGPINIPNLVTGLSGIKNMAASAYNTMACKDDGTIWVWGTNRFGQLGTGTSGSLSNVPLLMQGANGVPLKDIVNVTVSGTQTMVVLKSDGTVWAWGDNTRGGLGQDTTFGNSSPFPHQIAGLSTVKAIAAGVAHIVALKSDGTVWAWGSNQYSQLGGIGGNHVDELSHPISTVPVQVLDASGSPMRDVVAIAAGGYFTVAQKSDSTIWTWGANDHRQLGIDPTSTMIGNLHVQSVPVQVTGLFAFTTVLMPGSGVESSVGPDVTVTFEGTVSGGKVTAIKITSTEIGLPANFRATEGSVYEITTDATYSGIIKVCIAYDPKLLGNIHEENLRLFQESWHDITISVDTVANKICGSTNTLSQFAVAFKTPPPQAKRSRLFKILLLIGMVVGIIMIFP